MKREIKEGLITWEDKSSDKSIKFFQSTAKYSIFLLSKQFLFPLRVLKCACNNNYLFEIGNKIYLGSFIFIIKGLKGSKKYIQHENVESLS